MHMHSELLKHPPQAVCCLQSSLLSRLRQLRLLALSLPSHHLAPTRQRRLHQTASISWQALPCRP